MPHMNDHDHEVFAFGDVEGDFKKLCKLINEGTNGRLEVVLDKENNPYIQIKKAYRKEAETIEVVMLGDIGTRGDYTFSCYQLLANTQRIHETTPSLAPKVTGILGNRDINFLRLHLEDVKKANALLDACVSRCGVDLRNNPQSVQDIPANFLNLFKNGPDLIASYKLTTAQDDQPIEALASSFIKNNLTYVDLGKDDLLLFLLRDETVRKLLGLKKKACWEEKQEHLDGKSLFQYLKETFSPDSNANDDSKLRAYQVAYLTISKAVSKFQKADPSVQQQVFELWANHNTKGCPVVAGKSETDLYCDEIQRMKLAKQKGCFVFDITPQELEAENQNAPINWEEMRQYLSQQIGKDGAITDYLMRAEIFYRRGSMIFHHNVIPAPEHWYVPGYPKGAFQSLTEYSYTLNEWYKGVLSRYENFLTEKTKNPALEFPAELALQLQQVVTLGLPSYCHQKYSPVCVGPQLGISEKLLKQLASQGIKYSVQGHLPSGPDGSLTIHGIGEEALATVNLDESRYRDEGKACHGQGVCFAALLDGTGEVVEATFHSKNAPDAEVIEDKLPCLLNGVQFTLNPAEPLNWVGQQVSVAEKVNDKLTLKNGIPFTKGEGKDFDLAPVAGVALLSPNGIIRAYYPSNGKDQKPCYEIDVTYANFEHRRLLIDADYLHKNAQELVPSFAKQEAKKAAPPEQAEGADAGAAANMARLGQFRQQRQHRDNNAARAATNNYRTTPFAAHKL